MNERYFPRSEASMAGSALAQARQAQKLTVPEVARHLKLTPAQVEALEEGAYERLPGRVFVRGFLRNYAKLVKIDVDPLLRSFEHDMPLPQPLVEAPQTRKVTLRAEKRSRWPLFAGFVFALVAALAVYEFGFNEPEPEGTQESALEPLTPLNPDPAPPPAVKAPVGPGPIAAGKRLSVESLPVEPARAPRSGEKQLQLRFEVDSWIEIRDRNDTVIYSKLNRAGSDERVNVAPPVKLIIGNARGVRLNYDNRAVDLTPHIGVSVARLTVE